MPKLCQKCHKNPAVVHFRAYDRDGHHSTVSYCLSCAVKMLSEEDTPDELRQMLQGMVNDLKEDFPGELEAALQEDQGDSTESGSSLMKELFSHAQSRRHRPSSEKSKPSKSFCPCCHRDLELAVLTGEPLMKCGHCLTTVREVLRKCVAADLSTMHQHSPETLGMPVFCRKGHSNPGGKDKATAGDACERLASLLQRYHAAALSGKTDGAELLKEELNCLRREFTEEIRRNATPAPLDDVADFLALPRLHPFTLRNEVWRFGWLPQAVSGEAQIRLASAVIFQRTIVDWPMPKDATAEDYHKRLAQFLWRDPIFEGGRWLSDDYSLSTKNHRLTVDCGKGEYCRNRSFHFEGQMLGKPGEGAVLMKHTRAFLRRLEHRCTFFTDPELGFYSPRREALGSCIYPVEYLHLPALCMAEGLTKIQDAVQGLEGSGLTDARPLIRVAPIEGVPLFYGEHDEQPIGFVALWDMRSCGTPLRDRVQTLNRIAKFLEKEELRARHRLRVNSIRRHAAEDEFARALALLQNARLMSQREALLAVSRVWLGVEVGCMPFVSKKALFEIVTSALMTDDDYAAGLEQRRHNSIEVPTIPPLDYVTPNLDDLDQLGEVLWEDQDADIVLPAPGESKRSASDPLGLGDIFEKFIGEPGELLRHIKDAFEHSLTPPHEDPEEKARRQVLRYVRARVIRAEAKKLKCDGKENA